MSRLNVSPRTRRTAMPGQTPMILARLALIAAFAGVAAAHASESALRAQIARHAEAQGVPVALAKAVVRLESGFRPRVVSKGNYGLMQIRLGTARALGYRGGANGLLDAETNLTYGMRYLAQAWRGAGGDICRTIMRYQSGPGATRLNGANRAYCARARALIARGA